MLYQASFMGNTNEVKELLKNGAHVDEQNEVRKYLDIVSTLCSKRSCVLISGMFTFHA